MRMIIDNSLVFCHNIKTVTRPAACNTCAFPPTACPPNICHLCWVLNYQPLSSCIKFCNSLDIDRVALTGAINNHGFNKICISLSCNSLGICSNPEFLPYRVRYPGFCIVALWFLTDKVKDDSAHQICLQPAGKENGEGRAYPFF